MNNNKKHKMRPFEIVLSVILTLALIGLIYFGYYKQNKVLDAYESFYAKQDELNQEEAKELETVEMNSETVSKLFPLGQVKYNDDIVLSIDLVNYVQAENSKNNLLFLGAKKQEKKQDAQSNITNTNASTNTMNTTNTAVITTQTITNTIQNAIISSLSSKSNYLTDILAIEPELKKDNEDNLYLEFKAVYVRDLGDTKLEDGTTVNVYNCYQRYNFETDMFLSRLTDNVYSKDLIESTKTIDTNELEKHIIKYKFNQELNNYTYDNYEIE